VPRLWASSEPVPDAGRVWQALVDLRPETGLVPITLAFLGGGHAGRPWDEGEFDDRCDLMSLDGVDAARVLADNWDLKVPVDPDERDAEMAETIAPFGWDFPGLATGQDQALTEAELARALDWFKLARIGLVPASRPADVLAVIGLNDVNRNVDPALPAAVLRSWEDRFGAVLVEVGFAHIRLLARRPPPAANLARYPGRSRRTVGDVRRVLAHRPARYGVPVRRRDCRVHNRHADLVHLAGLNGGPGPIKRPSVSATKRLVIS
jgi:hypothetical protein